MYESTIKKLRDAVLSKGKPQGDHTELRYRGITIEYYSPIGSKRFGDRPIEAVFPESMRVYRHRIFHNRELLLETRGFRIMSSKPDWEKSIQQILDVK